MIDLKYRIDFVRLENESMPEGENINDGSTCYIIDTAELFIFYKGTWYNSDIEKQNESEQNESGQSENNQRNNETTEENVIKNDEVIKIDDINKENIIKNDEVITKDEGSDLNDK